MTSLQRFESENQRTAVPGKGKLPHLLMWLHL